VTEFTDELDVAQVAWLLLLAAGHCRMIWPDFVARYARHHVALPHRCLAYLNGVQ
jgi:hypothetical protein